MTRFNYLYDAPHIAFPSFATTLAIDNRIRGPLAALVAIVFLTGLISLVQFSRLLAAQHAYAGMSARLTASEASVEAMKIIRARVDAKKRLVAHIADLRGANIVQLTELAWIGNHLPSDVWLTTLRYEDGKYSLEGTSDRVAAVGTALLTLRGDGHSNTPRLVTLRSDATASGPHVRYTLQFEPQL